MPLIGTLLKRGIKIRESLEQDYSMALELQKQELRKLLIHAEQTEFGRAHGFRGILKSFKSKSHDEFYRAFSSNIPIYNYSKIFSSWWHRTLDGQPNVCWPGKIKYFALSSGTSEASSKYIPITKEMTKSIRKSSVRQMLTMSKYDLPSKFFETGILMIGGSTHLNKRGHYFYGDLSGIQAANLPLWFQRFYKPGRKIAATRDWDNKLEEITASAPKWDIGIVVGVPAWIQILLEKIIEYHNLDHIHQIWPNFKAYVHSGVAFDPYKKGFEKLLGEPVYFVEAYLASEGFIAFQNMPRRKGMRMVLNGGIFYEFVPFNESNFDADGEILPDAECMMIDEVQEGVEYALLMSTCAGAWRYLIGDVIKFVSKENNEIVITGRTKHFLSLTGEHLSVDNMNQAIELTSEELGVEIKEFAVAGLPHGSLFRHHWYLGTDDKCDPVTFRDKLDAHLMELNDDYRTERSAALKEVMVDIFPSSVFYGFLDMLGKSGGAHKFPRVIKGDQLEKWESFISERSV